MLCLCSKTYYCYDQKNNKYKLSSEALNRTTLEDCGDWPMSKYCEELKEEVIFTSTNRGFRIMRDSVATYEQTEKGFPYFYPKGLVEEHGIRTKQLDL